MGKLFGTDGIRGKVGEKINGDIAYSLGNALGHRSCLIVVGRDTRLSGVELEKYLKKGILDAGCTIIELGIVPTPVVAFVTEHMRADFGVVITASHNSKEYNGLKVFSKAGAKLEHSDIDAIEKDMMTNPIVSDTRGKIIDGRPHIDEYKKSLYTWFSGISGLNIVIDPANGALSHFAKGVFDKITHGVVAINDEGDGEHINDISGALYPETVRKEVLGQNADIGFAFDGDGDRIIAVDEKGKIVNGDLILYAIACYMKENGTLDNNIAVGTCYTNMGVEKALEKKEITLLRSETGDSNVAELMRNKGGAIGAERSGHVIASHYTATGDGILVALLLCKIMTETKRPLSELTDIYEYPMSSFDKVTDRGHEIVADKGMQDFIKGIEKDIKDRGRVLIRPSGTEAKLRIMVEAESEELVTSVGLAIENYIAEKFNVK